MSALNIIRTLKADRNRVLWINHDRREAALSPDADSVCLPVDYNDACVARTDTNLCVADECDGEIIHVI